VAKHFTLPKENYASLLAAERNLHDALGELTKAEECGIDCSPLRIEYDEAMKRIEAIKRNFAPPGQIA